MERRPDRTISYFDVLEACAGEGCPLCHIAERVVRRYLDSILYEYVNDPGVRAGLRRSLGYCNEHAWRLPQVEGGPALGVAILYQDLLAGLSRRLAGVKAGHDRLPAGAWLARALRRLRLRPRRSESGRRLTARAACPACEHRERMEAIVLHAMLRALEQQDPRMRAALEASQGLCLPHLRRALELDGDGRAAETLLEVSRARLAALEQDLREFIRKRDYRFQHEPAGDEADSWRRAIAWVAARRGVR